MYKMFYLPYLIFFLGGGVKLETNIIIFYFGFRFDTAMATSEACTHDLPLTR